MIKEHLAEVPSVGKIELEEHLAPQRNMPPKIVPSRQAGVDRVTELLQTTNERTKSQCISTAPIVPSFVPVDEIREPPQ